ncbi:unnamed protein product [Protopolystoma xenopodis]|uniref:Uncharacterized protein n=1 Tax=Protopolystoma xenopodis TaxID=117903 RepID=A0A448XKF3_9PLAT|nr:unnamed protein product [Protopolystoma xenopodis]
MVFREAGSPAHSRSSRPREAPTAQVPALREVFQPVVESKQTSSSEFDMRFSGKYYLVMSYRLKAVDVSRRGGSRSSEWLLPVLSGLGLWVYQSHAASRDVQEPEAREAWGDRSIG